MIKLYLALYGTLRIVNKYFPMPLNGLYLFKLYLNIYCVECILLILFIRLISLPPPPSKNKKAPFCYAHTKRGFVHIKLFLPLTLIAVSSSSLFLFFTNFLFVGLKSRYQINMFSITGMPVYLLYLLSFGIAFNHEYAFQ